MTVRASSDDLPSPLSEVERRAGAVFAHQDGVSVAVSYGSAAGELAACVSAAGLTDCSAMTKLELSGSASTISRVTARVTGTSIAPGGALHAAGAWWCRLAGEQAIVLGEPGAGKRLLGQLRAHGVQQPDLQVADRSGDWGLLAVVGRRTADVLRALGVYGEAGDPRATPPFCDRAIGGVRALWLLESDHRAMALVDRGQAAEAWRAIERSGRQLGLCCVGSEAASRYTLLQRRPIPASPG